MSDATITERQECQGCGGLFPPDKFNAKVNHCLRCAAEKGLGQERERDQLDELAEGDPRKVIALMLWQARHRNPELAVQLTLKDINAFEKSCAYLGVVPDVLIVRPEGRPAQIAIPEQHGKRAVPARPAEPPRPFVLVGLVKKGTTDGFRAIESEESEAQLRDEATRLRRAKERAPLLAALLVQMAVSSTYSSSEVQEAAQVLQVLAQSA